jgi:hypothetical protein
VSENALRAETDLTVADWIAPRLGEIGSVAGTAPGGFHTYVRVCHPAERDQRPYTWPQVAAETGHIAHPVMQWHALVDASDSLNMSDSQWPGSDPRRGNVEPDVLRALVDVLAAHTTTPQTCTLGLWNGYGFIDGGTTNVAYPAGSGKTGGTYREPPAFSRDRPILSLPWREYFLFGGAVTAALDMSSRWDQSPNLLWPEDRGWFMASEIDFDSTVIAGSSELAHRLLQNPTLDAWEVQPEDRLSADADTINPAPPGRPA